jgi:hypothetical protein
VTQLQTLSVEFDELMARANELAAPIPAPPRLTPIAPCRLQMIKERPTQELLYSASDLRDYLAAGERERQRLAQSLRNAAIAYQGTDEGAAEALTNNTSVSAVMPGLADGDNDQATLTERVSLMASEAPPYLPVHKAAADLLWGDQGISFLEFADAWAAYAQTLLDARRRRFRLFLNWDSDASRSVEQNFDQHKQWLEQMAKLCEQLAAQTRRIVSAHRWAVTAHPALKFIQALDARWRAQPESRTLLMKSYAELQKKSEEVLAEYARRAGLPLSPVNPTRPPVAFKIDGPKAETKPIPQPDPGPLPGPGPLPLPDGGLPSGGFGIPGLPVIPSVPIGGSPSMSNDAQLTQALRDLKGSPGLPPGAGLKPASVGVGRAGVPSMPLQPLADAEALSRVAAAAPGGPGRGIPGAAAALGGGGMGMPMCAPGGQGKDAGNGKRAQQEDDEIYIEDRPWTEGIIGIFAHRTGK